MLSSQQSLPTVAFEDKQIATTVEDPPNHTTQTPTGMENLVATSHETSDVVLAYMAISIKNLVPEQLVRLIIKAAENGLSEYQLSTIIMASQEVLNSRQQFRDF